MAYMGKNLYYKTILLVILTLLSMMACTGLRPFRLPEEPYRYETEQARKEFTENQQPEVLSGKGAIAEVVQKISPAVVGISTVETTRESIWEGPVTVQGLGSGVIVHSDGYILTNDHVAGRSFSSITVILENGDELEGITLWSDPTLDLAMVKVDAINLPVAPLGDSEKLVVGEPAIAVGTPLALQFQHTVTAGIISALNRTVRIPTELGENFMEDLIQTDASINPGNSGGPLVNIQGQVVGINTIKVSSAEGIGFAIPIDVAQPIIRHFVEEGSFTTPYIGIVGFDREIASYYKRDPSIQEGVYVVEMDHRGPAYRAGIRVDDIITQVGNQKIGKMLELRKAVYSYRVGQTIEIHILRGSQKRKVTMALEEKPI